jgi:2-dehydro-3-deoxyphosphogluconate aldolase/(4S)-4-hydroxy-2-oxoglutarate aldolase
MRKHMILKRIHDAGMVAIVRADSAEAALAVAEACIAGGVTALEVAFTTPGTLDVITALRQRHGDAVLIGAGTVLDAPTARMAILAGAQFIISPAIDLPTIRMCLRYQIPALPGAMTPSEIIAALEAGADIVKVFPGEAFGPAYIKALLAPLPHAPLMPTGGVTLDNMADWFKQGSVAVGIGGSLSAPARDGNYAAVTANAREFVQRMAHIRGLA